MLCIKVNRGIRRLRLFLQPISLHCQKAYRSGPKLKFQPCLLYSVVESKAVGWPDSAHPATLAPYAGVSVRSSLRSSRSCSQFNTSSSTHPTLLGPSCIRFGNVPAFSSLATCCGEYRTNSLSWRFESIRISISPCLKSIAMP